MWSVGALDEHVADLERSLRRRVEEVALRGAFAQREDDHDKLLARIKEEKLPMEAYNWYLDLRRYGTKIDNETMRQ